MKQLIFFLLVIELLHIVIGQIIKNGEIVQQVPFGENVVLSCKSSDENHIFEYWLLHNNFIVGPTSEYFDTVKFDYEVLSGNLIIRSVSKSDEGIYNCVSRSVDGNSKKVEGLKIMVAQDLEDVYENDPNINFIRILIILITLVLLGIGSYVVFRMWKDRYRYPSYLDDGEEGSAEDIFNSPGTSGTNISRSPGKIVLDKTELKPSKDSTGTSTDFKSILKISEAER